MADIKTITLPNGNTYNLRDGNAVPSTRTVNGKALSSDIELGYHIECEENTSVGTAKTGTAKTGTSNYTPSGEIDYETKTIRSIGGIGSGLAYGHNDYVLCIYGIDTNVLTSSETVVTAINGFNGNGVMFEIKENDE